MTRWEQLAEVIRTGIASGAYLPGSTIPKERELMAAHGVSRTTVRQAIAQLTAEGLVQPVRRGGTKVRSHPPRTRITRTRKVYRDEIGYYFDPTAQPWRALQTPTVAWGPCPYDVARLLNLDAGTEVLVRDRIMGDPATATAHQLATSYLPADLTRGTILAHADTGPGGIYDRLEEMGHGPLRWSEMITARVPTPTEVKRLRMAAGTPVLRVLRLTTSPTGAPLEVNDTRLDAERYEIGYPIDRDRTAKGP